MYSCESVGKNIISAMEKKRQQDFALRGPIRQDTQSSVGDDPISESIDILKYKLK
jgi:hypothetical protein